MDMALIQNKSRIFVGYSSVDTSIKGTIWADLDLIKRDLVNHFYTRRGERVMNPDFGCVIWDLLFEPMTQDNIQAILDDCYRIVTSDGRVSINNIDIIQYDSGLQLQMDLYYQPLNAVDSFRLNFDQKSVDSATA
jgi:phage baseplate assembly protein W